MGFSIGDRVRAKCGGPIMVVCSCSEGGMYTCTWWNDNAGIFSQWVFYGNTLEKVEVIND